MKRISVDELRLLPGLKVLPRVILEGLVRSGHRMEIRKNRIVSYQKDRCDYSFCILSGRFRKVKYLSDESSVKIGTLHPGDWIGIAELLLKTEFLFDTIAEENSVIISFSSSDFARLMVTDGFSDIVMKRLSREVVLLHRSMELNTSRARIIRLLQERTEFFEDEAAVHMTQEEIAEETGTTRETVNRFLKELEKLDVVDVGRGILRIVNVDELDKMG